MSKEQEQKMNGHKHNTRNQTKQGMYTSPFFKRKRKRSFQHLTLNRVIWGPLVQKKEKRS